MVTTKEWNQALFDATDLSTTEFAVGIAIGSFANWDTGDHCWPSQETISARSKASLTTVKRATKGLVAKGYLIKIRPERFQGFNQYVLRLPPADDHGSVRPLIPVGAGPEFVQPDPPEGPEVASTYSSTSSDTSSSSQESSKELQGSGHEASSCELRNASGAMSNALTPNLMEPPLSPMTSDMPIAKEGAGGERPTASTEEGLALRVSSKNKGAAASKEEGAGPALQDDTHTSQHERGNRFSRPGVRCVGDSDRRHAKRLLGPQDDYSSWLEREYPIDHPERDFGEASARLAASSSFMPKDGNWKVRVAMAQSDLRKRGPYKFRATWHGPPTPKRFATAH